MAKGEGAIHAGSSAIDPGSSAIDPGNNAPPKDLMSYTTTTSIQSCIYVLPSPPLFARYSLGSRRCC
jgi:hypothetical protein